MAEQQRTRRKRIVIVGAGFSGIAMAVRLKQRGIDDFVMLERASDVGGTWHHNTYPGCMCDVPSHLYSLSFAPNHGWSHTYSPQEEIREYLRSCVDRFGLRAHLETGVEVQRAEWAAKPARWELDTSGGPFSAEMLISCMGPLTEPMIPSVPGLEQFEGKVMHSARWDHNYALEGKRVASIGTGASAIQYVPEIRRDVEQLFVFQRTPPWVMPHGDRPITDRERALYRRLPAAQRLVRGAVYASRELMVLGFTKRPSLMRPIAKLSRSHMRRQVSDPELLARVTPDYTIGCKRLLPSNRWYPALQAPNVELVSSELREVGAHSVLDDQGVEREVDAIIFGTGFHVTDTPYAGQLRGRDGKLMSEIWEGSPRAYLGTSVPDFPNLFVLLGPNTGLGHSSMVYMIESQVAHVLAALEALQRSGSATIEVRADAHREFNCEVDERMSGTVWDTGGCSSFYVDRTGRNATLWPDWTWRFRRRAARLDAAAYSLEGSR